MRRLADGTELIGEYKGSGYQEPKYLLRRCDGQVMQLPALLYRVASSLDGRRDDGELACALSAELGQDLTADDIAFLVEERLRPVGIVAPDVSGSDPDVGEASAPPVRSDPLLALRFRVGVVPASAVWRIAGVFRPLFLRPVWIAAVASFLALDVLIILRSSVFDQSIAGVDVLVDRPALMLAIIGLTLLSGMFHECGHATACRYGGARPGVMGVGLYIIWPALYTNVTDAYRLDRIGRLRTDLGGVYFNAIFMAGVSLLYLTTGQPWLLLVLIALHTETAWQFLPSIRLDGYYILADLVGVPDLFSYLRPVCASLVPGRPTDPRVGKLRPWSRRLIVLWVVLVVPTLLGYLVGFLILAPHVIPVVWDGLIDYLGTIEQAARAGEVATTALSVFQLVMFLLPWVGTLLISASFVGALRRYAATRWGWGWVQPGVWSAVRRYAVLVAVGGFAVALIARVAVTTATAPASAAETRITASAFGVLLFGPGLAPAVDAGESFVRDQLVAYAWLTGAFHRHDAVLGGARELAVLACVVLVACLLVLGTALRWRPATVALPLAGAAAMGPVVSTLAAVGPGVVGAAWTATGVTALVFREQRPGGRHRRPHLLTRRRVLLGLGVAALALGIASAPLVAVPMAVGSAVLVLRRENAVSRELGWTAVVGGAFGLVLLAALVAPPLLGTPARSVLTGSERDVLVLLASVVVVGGVLAIRALRWTAVIAGPLVVLVAVNAPGADVALPLLVAAVVGVGALIVDAWTSRPVQVRPHPLLRALLAVPVLVLVVVGGIFLPAHTSELPHRHLASWILASPSAGPALETPPALWADLVRDGVPVDRLRLEATPSHGVTAWTIVAGDPGPEPRTAARLGSGTELVTVLRPAREPAQRIDVEQATPPSNKPSGSGAAPPSESNSGESPAASAGERRPATNDGSETDHQVGARAERHDVPDRHRRGSGEVGDDRRDHQGHGAHAR
ncbi:hypothetical protein ACQP04_14190 [Pseudonocardia halophobica]|uniref:hypothetical protein n=1 Tax=Pseudonocardia halophobica TaxID=29401 RepID=UPI003D8D9F61